MSTTFIYDDTHPVPSEVAALTGIERFGRLLHNRVRIDDHALAAASGLHGATRLSTLTDRKAFIQTLVEAPADRRYAYMTSDVVEAEPEHLQLFLAKLAYSHKDLVGRPEGSGPSSLIAVLSADLLRDLLNASDRASFLAENRHRYSDLPAPGLSSIHEIGNFVRFVSGTFYARAFNNIRTEPRTVVKESADRGKMRREHDFWYQLPPELQRFLVQPYGYEESSSGARYKMERYVVPDMAILWIHDALSAAEFATFLDAVFAWIETVPRREEDRSAALYVDKVEQRYAALMQMPEGRQLDSMIASGTPYAGLEAVFARYRSLLERDAGPHRIAIQHGDLCFSNILYDKRTGLLKFVDPRGATTPDETWGDATYDLAKLSHSVMGGYDFLNNGLFDVGVNDTLGLQLELHEPDGRDALRAAFLERLKAAGFDPVRIRLYEASLFLSMLPLHRESPRKLLGFVLNAIRILDQVEAAGRNGALGRMLG